MKESYQSSLVSKEGTMQIKVKSLHRIYVVRLSSEQLERCPQCSKKLIGIIPFLDSYSFYCPQCQELFKRRTKEDHVCEMDSVMDAEDEGEE